MKFGVAAGNRKSHSYNGEVSSTINTSLNN